MDLNEKNSIEQEGSHINLTIEMVMNIMKTLKNNKSSGIGGIPTDLIKFGREKLYHLLQNLFQKCLNSAKNSSLREIDMLLCAMKKKEE